MSDSRQAAAAMLMLGFHGDSPTPGIRRLLQEGAAGCILFARNIPDPRKVRELTGALKGVRTAPVLLGVDQEGGRVQRLREPYTEIPAMRTIGATGDPALAAAAGTILAREMRFAGFDVVFAPVMDVDTNPANPVIGARSFGPTPELVSRMGSALITAMQSQGVAASAKHFPGHGDTSQDSHHNLPKLKHTLSRLEQVELPPFQAAIKAGVASIMSAHVIFTPLDPDYPATMSRPALGGILRDRFSYDGVIFSDDIEMKALADHYALEEQLLLGVEAGIDLFLICHTEALQFQAIDILASAIDKGVIPSDRVSATLRRVNTLVSNYARSMYAGTLAEIQSHSTHKQAISLLEPLSQDRAPDPTRFK